MGLDVTLGVLVLLAGIRGWFKGFVRQAIPIAALVGCVYLADPLRDLARPHAREFFPSIGHGILDRLLWWISAVVGYLATSGIAFAIVKSFRKRTYGEPEPNRTDQGAGFTLGVVKGLVIASCIASALQAYGPKYYEKAPFVEDQAKKSRAMEWADRFHPAETLWKSPPVRAAVARVKTRGLGAEEEAPALAKPKPVRSPQASEPVQTASERPKTLSLPRTPDPESPDFVREIREALKREGLDPDSR